MQVGGNFTNPENWNDNDFFIGADRSGNFIPLKSLQNNNALITLSSDWDVSSPNPFVGIENAITRVPQELPDIATAIKAYTINGAYVMRQENVTGSLEVGKFADLVVVDRDIFTIPQSQISQANILLTWLAGNEVYINQILDIEAPQSTNPSPIVYPTQANENVNVYFKTQDASTKKLIAYNTAGKEVLSKTVSFNQTNNFEVTLDITSLSEGIYILEIPSVGNKNVSKKFIVSR
jgi:hypothetical protein